MKYRITDSNYYGLPKDMDIDGVRDTGELCATYTRQGSRNAGNITVFQTFPSLIFQICSFLYRLKTSERQNSFLTT